MTTRTGLESAGNGTKEEAFLWGKRQRSTKVVRAGIEPATHGFSIEISRMVFQLKNPANPYDAQCIECNEDCNLCIQFQYFARYSVFFGISAIATNGRMSDPKTDTP
jgi:hypothetical protein